MCYVVMILTNYIIVFIIRIRHIQRIGRVFSKDICYIFILLFIFFFSGD